MTPREKVADGVVIGCLFVALIGACAGVVFLLQLGARVLGHV